MGEAMDCILWYSTALKGETPPAPVPHACGLREALQEASQEVQG